MNKDVIFDFLERLEIKIQVLDTTTFVIEIDTFLRFLNKLPL